MSRPHITVVGRASRWAPADAVEVAFTVRHRARDADRAVELAADAYRSLDGILRNHVEDVVRRVTTSLRVQELVHWEGERNRRVSDGFEASRTETARLAPVARAGAVIGAVLVGVPDVLLASPVFVLDPDNPVHAEVRSAAAAAALASATAYAAGVGLTLGAVRWLREPAVDHHPVDHGLVVRSMALEVKASDEPGVVFGELSAEDVEVGAAVELEAELLD